MALHATVSTHVPVDTGLLELVMFDDSPFDNYLFDMDLGGKAPATGTLASHVSARLLRAHATSKGFIMVVSTA